MKIGLNTDGFGALSLDDCLDRMAALGMEAIAGVVAAGWRANIAIWPGAGASRSHDLLDTLFIGQKRPVAVVAGGQLAGDRP